MVCHTFILKIVERLLREQYLFHINENELLANISETSSALHPHNKVAYDHFGKQHSVQCPSWAKSVRYCVGTLYMHCLHKIDNLIFSLADKII